MGFIRRFWWVGAGLCVYLIGNLAFPAHASNIQTGALAPTSALFVNSNASAQLGALTAAQATAALNLFTSSLQGVAPSSGGGTVNFLRADGSWAVPAGTGVPTVVAPYLLIGSTYYTTSRYTAVRPSGSPTWINSVAPTTVMAGVNGDLLIAGSGVYWASQAAAAAVEGEFQFVNLTATGTSTTVNGGVWLFDSTNSKIYKLHLSIPNVNTNTTGSSAIAVDIYTYNGSSGNPAYSSTPAIYDFPNGSAPVHLKMSVTGSTLSFLISLDGGATYATFGLTESVGTITKGGYGMVGNASMTVLSIATT